MSRKRKNNQFYWSKDVPKTDNGRKPFVGSPNSNMDTYDKKDGRFSSRRRFGNDGYAVKDLDIADSHKSYDHVHEITYNYRSLDDRKPSKQEQREINKAKKKRRFWEK